MMNTKELDWFGEFLVENLRDSGIEFTELLLKAHWKALDLQNLQHKLETFSEEQKEIVMDVVVKTIDKAIHNFLYAVQEESEFDNGIQIMVNGKNIAELSDGLQGEGYSNNGWYAKYSKYAKRYGI